MSNFELNLNLFQIFDAARYLLKDNGEIFMIHKPERLDDVIISAKKNKINVRKLKFIHSKKNKNATLVLIKCIKSPKTQGIEVEPPLIISE